MTILKIKDSTGEWVDIPAIVSGIPNLTFEVETLEPGSEATVTQGGTKKDPIIKLGIPKGSKGDTGDTSNLVNKTGSRGSLAGYETPVVTSNAVTIDQSSNDVTQVTGAVVVTVSNGSSKTAWTKLVGLTNASATISLGTNWRWAGGEVPTVFVNSVLVLHWCSSFGIANLIASE